MTRSRGSLKTHEIRSYKMTQNGPYGVGHSRRYMRIVHKKWPVVAGHLKNMKFNHKKWPVVAGHLKTMKIYHKNWPVAAFAAPAALRWVNFADKWPRMDPWPPKADLKVPIKGPCSVWANENYSFLHTSSTHKTWTALQKHTKGYPKNNKNEPTVSNGGTELRQGGHQRFDGSPRDL